MTRFYNPHLSTEEWDTLFNAAETFLADKTRSTSFTIDAWPEDKPVFHPYSPAKQDGFYGQLSTCLRATSTSTRCLA